VNLIKLEEKVFIKKLSTNILSTVDGIMLVYDLSNTKTFVKMTSLKEKIKKHTKNFEMFGYFLIGNKKDVSKVKEKEKEKFISEFFENSDRKLLSEDVEMNSISYDDLVNIFEVFIENTIKFHSIPLHFLKKMKNFENVESNSLKKSKSMNNESVSKKKHDHNSFSKFPF
jgi:hypothetical protein